MVNKIICYSCNKPIRSKNDLITSFYFVLIKPFHSSCYSQNLKTFKTIFLKNYPINGISGTLSAILAPIFGLIFILLIFFGGEPNQRLPLIFNIIIAFFIALFVIALPIFIRLYSYYRFEKQIRTV